MDCEKFESAMMDELYGELDEITSAALRRHIAGCARCASLLAGLQATRRLAVIPRAEPPSDLEARILAAAVTPTAAVPLRRRLAAAVSVAGGWAMRPQTAMAAVFLVSVGTSVLLLREKSSRAPAGARVTVIEQGSPAPASPSDESTGLATPGVAPSAAFAVAPRPPEAESPRLMAKSQARPSPPPGESEPWETAEKLRRPGAGGALAGGSASPHRLGDSLLKSADADDLRVLRVAEAPPAAGPTPVASPPGTPLGAVSPGAASPAMRAAAAPATATPSDGDGALGDARAIRASRGCRAAVGRFDEAARRAAGTSTAWDALLEGGRCYRLLGDAPGARARLTPLLDVDAFRDRAQLELNLLRPIERGP